MPPRSDEQQASTSPTATPPCSPLLPSRNVSVLVGNDQGLLAIPSLTLGNDAKDENTTPSSTTIKEKLFWTLHAAAQEHRQLLEKVQSQQQTQQHNFTAALLDACLFSLQGTAVTLMEDASRLVESMDATTPIAMTLLSRSKSSSSSSLASLSGVTSTTNMTMGRIRASLAVRWALQYLASIRNALQQSTNSAFHERDLDSKLQRLLDQLLTVASSPKRTFRISPWMLSPSQLAFDIMVGDTTSWTDYTRMSLSVDPMWQVKAEDLERVNDGSSNESRKSAPSTISTCTVHILQVTPRGNGEALVRVGVTPLSVSADSRDIHHLQQRYLDMAKMTKKEKVVWGQDTKNAVLLQRKFHVQEARV